MSDDERKAARLELLKAAQDRGIPRDFAEALAQNLGGPNSMRRMAGYLRQTEHLTPQLVADEMLAIVEQRDEWARKKMSEHANASVSRWYNRP